MKKSELKEMIKAAFMNEAGPNIDMSMASLANAGDETLPNKAFGDKDDLNLPDFVKTRTAADVKNAADVAEKTLEFLSLIEKGEKINYSEYGAFKPVIKMLLAIARPSLPGEGDAAGLEESLDEMLARLSEEEVEEVVNEAEEDEDVKVKVKVDAEDLEDEVDVKDTDLSADDKEVETSNDSIVVDKKIVSLSSLPKDTRKILDTLETLRAEAEEFGDQKFITQVGNTITFFTRDFVVAGDAPNPAGIEEGDGGLDLDVDSSAKETEMEAGLGLEESTFPMWSKIK